MRLRCLLLLLACDCLPLKDNPALQGVDLGPPQKALVVTPGGLSSQLARRITSYDVTISAGGMRIGGHQTFTTVPFTLPLDDATVGVVTVDVQAASPDGVRVLALGQGQITVDAPKRYPLAVPLSATPCQSDGWCWESPLPQGHTLYTVWGSADDDVWAAGEFGTILRWRGAGWYTVPNPTGVNATAGWSSGPGDAWAVGKGGAVIHWDGKTWTALNSKTSDDLVSVWGSSASDVWAVGGASLLHWTSPDKPPVVDPGKWSGLGAVAGNGPDNVWVTTQGCGVYHRKADGSWSMMILTAPDLNVCIGLYAMWVSGQGSVWVLAYGRFNVGANFQPFVTSLENSYSSFGSITTLSTPISVLGFSDQDISFASRGRMEHWDGKKWSYVSIPDAYGYWGSGPKSIWAVGDGGAMTHWDGTKWTPLHGPATAGLNSIQGTAPDDIWTGGTYGRILHWDGTGWTPEKTGISTSENVDVVWSSGNDDVWALTAPRTYHREQGQWRQRVDALGNSFAGNALWGSGPDNVWQVGGRTGAEHWDGKSWTPQTNGLSKTGVSDLYSVWGSGKQDLWAVDGGANVVHWDGATWNPAYTADGTPGLVKIWGVPGSPPKDIWAVGAIAVHWDGTAWKSFGSVADRALVAVSGTAGDDVWAASSDGLVHYDGVAWGRVPSPSTHTTLTGVWVAARGEMWLIGSQGEILHLQP